MHCDVVMVGYRLNAKEPAAKALERILGLTPEDARRLARAFPVTVVEGTSESDAVRIRDELQAAGALVELRAQSRAPGFVSEARTNARFDAAGAVQEPESPATRLTPEPTRNSNLGPRADLGTAGRTRLTPEPARSSNVGPRIDVALAAPTRRTPEPLRASSPGPSAALRPSPEPFAAVPPTPTSAPVVFPASATAAPQAQQDGSGAYQLGEFGFEIARSRTVSRPPSAPPPPRGADVSLDLELAAGLPLELDQPSAAGPSLDFGGRNTPANDLHSLGERFEELGPGRRARAPEVEEHAFRAIQRISKGHESRRPPPRQSASARVRSALTRSLRAWLPSLALLALLSAATAAAVGYALDPSDMLGVLRREGSADAFVPGRPQDRDLHPLLRATPSITRAPLASMLRARIAGVHEVPVSYEDGSKTVQCALVENVPGQTEARLEQVRQTGREIAPPIPIMAQLREHARALRAANARADLELTPICLAL